MGVSRSFGQAFAKAQLAAGQRLPRKGSIFLSVSDHDKRHFAPLAKELHSLGFNLIATRGTAAALDARGRRCRIRLQGERRPAEHRGPGQNRARWTWSSTRRSGANRSTTRNPSAAPPCATTFRASRRYPPPAPPRAAFARWPATPPTWPRSRICTAASPPRHATTPSTASRFLLYGLRRLPRDSSVVTPNPFHGRCLIRSDGSALQLRLRFVSVPTVLKSEFHVEKFAVPPLLPVSRRVYHDCLRWSRTVFHSVKSLTPPSFSPLFSTILAASRPITRIRRRPLVLTPPRAK